MIYIISFEETLIVVVCLWFMFLASILLGYRLSEMEKGDRNKIGKRLFKAVKQEARR